MSEQTTPTSEHEDESPAVSFKLLVTIALTCLFTIAVYILYSGATGTDSFRKVCEQGKGKNASLVLEEIGMIGEVGEPSENGTVIVQHPSGSRCVVRVTGDKVFSAIFEG